ncbi:hypothetical protein HYW73_01500 [Candidatus Nomurabacteria bacterium]|nr:hypothetical protein [Candidatus Nomurabacteria bacterium]
MATDTSAASAAVTETVNYKSERGVRLIRRVFGSAKSSVPLESTMGWNDVLCNQYVSLIDMNYAVSSASDTDWKTAGVSKDYAVHKYRESATLFAKDLEKLLLLPLSRRQQLENEWSRTCDGTLTPSHTGGLIGVLTSSLRESGVEKPQISDDLRKLLLKHYKQQFRSEEGMDKADALYWFTPEELGLLPEWATTPRPRLTPPSD